MKWTTVVVLSVLFAGAAVVGMMQLGGGTPVESAASARRDIRQYIDERGKTRLPETHLVTMPFAGRLEKIALEVGDVVKKDAAVARLVPADLQNEVDEAQAAVDRLQKSIDENADKKTEQLTLEQTMTMVDAMLDTVRAAENRITASLRRAAFNEDYLAKMRRLSAQGARTEEDVDRAEVAKVESDVSVEEDRLTVSIAKSMLAATQIMPKLVGQYMADQDLQRAVLEQEKQEAQARLRQVQTRQERSSMHSPVDGVVLAK
ncbi:MAG: hypothetical protein KDA41_12360, partial [Planctomycetales bacterium]|nr:hypothetical protein [Planctomycetales bacterium]